MADNFLSNVSEESLGQDVLLTPEDAGGGDFALSPDIDIAAESGFANLRSAILRRILTPKGLLSTYIFDVTGLIVTDQNYGNGAYKYLSEPLSDKLVSTMKDELLACLRQESRINVESIDATLVPVKNAYQVLYTINYTLTGSNDMEVLSLIQAGNSLIPQ